MLLQLVVCSDLNKISHRIPSLILAVEMYLLLFVFEFDCYLSAQIRIQRAQAILGTNPFNLMEMNYLVHTFIYSALWSSMLSKIVDVYKYKI